MICPSLTKRYDKIKTVAVAIEKHVASATKDEPVAVHARKTAEARDSLTLMLGARRFPVQVVVDIALLLPRLLQVLNRWDAALVTVHKGSMNKLYKALQTPRSKKPVGGPQQGAGTVTVNKCCCYVERTWDNRLHGGPPLTDFTQKYVHR